MVQQRREQEQEEAPGYSGFRSASDIPVTDEIAIISGPVIRPTPLQRLDIRPSVTPIAHARSRWFTLFFASQTRRFSDH